VNPYSIGIVGCLILIFFIFYYLAYKFDKEENKSKFYMKSQNYDHMQYYIIKFTKEGFHKEYNFFSLYFYLIKVKIKIIFFVNFYLIRKYLK